MAVVLATALHGHRTTATSLVRGAGDTLVLTVDSPIVLQSYGFTLRSSGYRVTRATLSAQDGVRTGYGPGQGPCAPRGASVVCHHLAYRTGVRQGVRSLTITFATTRCYPADGGLSRGIAGPTSPCPR